MKYHITLWVLLCCFAGITFGQFSGSVLTEYQYGNLPDNEDGDFSSVYNKLQLNYGYKDFRLLAGSELYYSPYHERNYIYPSWFGGSYKKNGWDIKAGNYNATVGRGLLLRSYDIPGALLEDKGFRSKQSFYRDLMGASV